MTPRRALDRTKKRWPSKRRWAVRKYWTIQQIIRPHLKNRAHQLYLKRARLWVRSHFGHELLPAIDRNAND